MNTKNTQRTQRSIVYSQCVLFFVYRRALRVTWFKGMRQFLKV